MRAQCCRGSWEVDHSDEEKYRTEVQTSMHHCVCVCVCMCVRVIMWVYVHVCIMCVYVFVCV